MNPSLGKEALRRLRHAAKYCHWCAWPVVKDHAAQTHRNAATIDHVRPRARNGDSRRQNVVVACRACNLTRGCIDARLWRAWLHRTQAGQRFVSAAPQQRSMNVREKLRTFAGTLLLVAFATGSTIDEIAS